jgi:hypothetical protein
MSDNTEHALFNSALGAMQSDLHDMKTSMSKMADAISKIAVLEERHQAMHNTMLRTLDKLEEQQVEINSIKLAQAKQDTAIKVSIKAIQIAWAILGSGLLAAAWFVVKTMATTAA